MLSMDSCLPTFSSAEIQCNSKLELEIVSLFTVLYVKMNLAGVMPL